MEKANILLAEEKKNEGEKGGKYFFAEEKEKGGKFLEMKNIFFGGKEAWRRKRRKISRRRKIVADRMDGTSKALKALKRSSRT